jgi:hypothetical protein
MVVRHLGVRQWDRMAFDEMDIVGPGCAPSLLARGPLWPPLLHTWPPIFEVARGGAMLTGEGGDELFDPIRCTAVRWLAAHPSQVGEPGVARSALRSVAPQGVRRRYARSVMRPVVPAWLRRDAAVEYLEELARWSAEEPYGWLASTVRSIRDRSHQVGQHNLGVLAAEHDLRLVHPLVDPVFVRACGELAGRFGFPGRTAAMRALFRVDLPDAVLARRDKVYTNAVVLAESTTAFARSWSGDGLDPSLVDAEVLRACLLRDDVPAASLLAVQTAWCRDHPAPRASAAPTA